MELLESTVALLEAPGASPRCFLPLQVHVSSDGINPEWSDFIELRG